MSLELEDLEKRYGTTAVVRGVSLRVRAGELVSLLGPSGCGKTTTLRAVAGLERPDAGRISIDGRVVDGPGVHVPPEARKLGMVFQSYAVWPHKRVRENVAYPLQRQGVRGAELSRRVDEALGWVRLSAFAERLPHALSGGQRQRVALARALVSRPRVLLLDEPLSNLDAALKEELRAELAALRNRLEMTLLYVTHDQAEALALSDRVAVMNHGVLEQVDTPERLYLDPATPFVAGFVGGANVLEGRVEGRALLVDGARFALPDGLDAPPGRVKLIVRPEDFELSEHGTALTLSARLFLGQAVEYRFPLGDRLLRLLGPARPARVGESLKLRIRRAKVFSNP